MSLANYSELEHTPYNIPQLHRSRSGCYFSVIEFIVTSADLSRFSLDLGNIIHQQTQVHYEK